MQTLETAMYPDWLPAEGSVFLITGRNGSGKTRMLSSIAKSLLDQRLMGRSQSLICLAGTVQDKYPRKEKGQDKYGYFGRRTNNNMFSELAPYRELIRHLSSHDARGYAMRAGVARRLLAKIDLGDEVGLRFRSPRKIPGISNRYSSESVAKGEYDVVLSLGELGAVQDSRLTFLNRAEDIDQKFLDLRGVSFKKHGMHIDLMDLSSGERGYALCILALSFCVTEGSTVLFDEPENSMHPSWQASIMRDMWSAISELSDNSRLIVATHSPMIVSGAPNERAYVLDMEASRGEWVHSSFYGNSSDTVLKQQFGMLSPRSMSFVTLVRDCLQSLVNVNSNPGKFIALVDQLKALDVRLDADDPLNETVSALLARRRVMQ